MQTTAFKEEAVDRMTFILECSWTVSSPVTRERDEHWNLRHLCTLSWSEETADCILAAATSCSDRNNNIMRILSPKLGEMRFGEFEGIAQRQECATIGSLFGVPKCHAIEPRHCVSEWWRVAPAKYVNVQSLVCTKF